MEIFMELYFKKPSKEARYAMSEAAMDIDYAVTRGYEKIKLAQDRISDLTGHKHVKLVNSGNSAILVAMGLFKGKILIPDQGGWAGFKKIAQFIGLETVEVPTELGVIDPAILEEFIDKHKVEALFITSFAGYIVEQPVKELFDVCNDKNVVLVEDASGGIGDREKHLSNGDYAHIIVASTGSPKIINAGSGGFISTNYDDFFKRSRFILRSLKANPVTCAGIAEEIKSAPSVLSKNIEACKMIKKRLDIAVYKDRRGISIALKTDRKSVV